MNNNDYWVVSLPMTVMVLSVLDKIGDDAKVVRMQATMRCMGSADASEFRLAFFQESPEPSLRVLINAVRRPEVIRPLSFTKRFHGIR